MEGGDSIVTNCRFACKVPSLEETFSGVSIETSTIYGRRLLEGVSAYIREKSDWRILVEQRSLHDRPPDWLMSWKGDGLISRATTQRIADELVRSGLPSIDVGDRVVVEGLPKVRSHDLAIGKLGATHFLERGLREFAFCGYERENWSRMRWEGFEAELSTQGFRPRLFESTWADIAAALKTAEESRIIACCSVCLSQSVSYVAMTFAHRKCSTPALSLASRFRKRSRCSA